MGHQKEWGGRWRYCFWVIGKERDQILLFYIVFSTNKLLRYPNQISNLYGILKLSGGGVKNSKLNIFNMWLISLDHVTNVYFQTKLMLTLSEPYDSSRSVLPISSAPWRYHPCEHSSPVTRPQWAWTGFLMQYWLASNKVICPLLCPAKIRDWESVDSVLPRAQSFMWWGEGENIDS